MRGRPAKLSARLRHLEAETRRLVRSLGDLSAEYDSARTASALGHLAQAAIDLEQAAIVRQAQEGRS